MSLAGSVTGADRREADRETEVICREPQGVVAIDQKGAKGSSRQTRLYVYAFEVGNTIYLITIGDKNSQKRDIEDCRQFVSSLRKE